MTDLAPIIARMQTTARTVRLPLRSQTWRGMSGSWTGAGTGSSIDFQDHRNYLPGDDPRYIDWLAYARSGHYTMKLYREEVSPLVDLALDVSTSMFLDAPKTNRTLELFHFALASALHARASVRCYLVGGGEVKALAPDAALAGEMPTQVNDNAPPALERIPWRAGSLRVWICDLLFEQNPALHPLALAKGRGVVLAPWCRAEGDPAWRGNVELLHCETAEKRNQRVTPTLLTAYKEAYTRHFALWREHARTLGIAFARVPAEPDFMDAICLEALPNGVVEMV